jgi:hypothetical protein
MNSLSETAIQAVGEEVDRPRNFTDAEPPTRLRPREPDVEPQLSFWDALMRSLAAIHT